MKKYLLLILICSSMSGFAQMLRNPAPVLESSNLQYKASNGVRIAPNAAQRLRSISTQSACPSTVFTCGPNAYGTGGSLFTSRQSCLTYNSDLNAVLWIHRASPLWAFSGYTSGAIQATWLDVSTNLWDSMIIYRDSSKEHQARYPGGALLNPIGNTNITNAQVVGSGPVTSKTGTPAWKGEWYASRQPIGNYHDPLIPNDVNFDSTSMAPFGCVGNTSNSNGFLNNDMQMAGSTIFVGGSLVDLSITTIGISPEKGGVIGKYSSGAWSADSIIPGFYYNPNTGYASAQTGMRLAFSPDGQTGYAVLFGRPAISYNNNSDSMLAPLVYKSTNGGASWVSTFILPGYDWTVGHPELFMNVGKMYTPPARQFQLHHQLGVDVTVDSLGTLHIVGTMERPFLGFNDTLTIDSMGGWSYAYQWDFVNYHPVIWDLMTNGTTWDALMIDSIMTGGDGMDTMYTTNPWYGGGIFSNSRIQVGRSATGGKIFYSWAESDTTITHTNVNSAPDIHMKSYDISNQLVTPSFNMTQGIGKCFFHYMSDIAYYDVVQGGWISPIVFTTERDSLIPPYDPSDTVDYNYSNCALFTSAQYTDSASVYRSMGGAAIASHELTNELVRNYPNPFSQNTTIVVNLEKQQLLELKVYDMMGKVVSEKRVRGMAGENKISFDGSGLNAGVYYYTLRCGEASVTQKMIMQK